MPHFIPSTAESRPAAKRDPSAFTLIELLIAILIAAILVGIAFYLFGATQKTTRTSTLRAQLALTGLTAEARLRDDVKYLLGPNRNTSAAGGCLVIIPAIRQGYVPLPNGAMSRNPVRLRSDQLVFISKRDPTHPHPWLSLLPQEQNVPPTAASTSYEARIWYGALRDGNLAPGSPESLQAHHWLVGRDNKLIQKTVAGPVDLTLDPLTDLSPGGPTASAATPGGLINVQTAAAGWTDAVYVSSLVGNGIPDNNANYTNPPTSTPLLDLKRLQARPNPATNPDGLQIDDLIQAHMRLLDNCSEIVIQWAGDLDKDGKIDTYPAGHPLAGSIIWYPEEFHANAAKDATTATRVAGPLQAAYANIKNNAWWKTFPANFAPALGIWPAGRFGDLTTPAAAPAPAWAGRFQFEYNETDGAGGSQSTAAPSVPAPYVFRFEDDQYRLVRYGFRQDGSVYANQFDAMAKNAPAAGGLARFPLTGSLDRHWTPYPPMPAGTPNPTPAQLYVGAAAAAPLGPYPLGATGASAAGLNFGDALGGAVLPGTYRSPNNTPDATHPFGQLLTVTQAGAVTVGADSAAGAETVYNPPADTPYDAGRGGDFGPTNNHTAVYGDLYSEYFKAVSDPARAGGITDWRNPQSDWPKLLRIRLRLHDAQGLVTSYSDEALMNGRDDDGDGVVDNPEEGRITGLWYEYILALPYPMDPTPRDH